MVRWAVSELLGSSCGERPVKLMGRSPRPEDAKWNSELVLSGVFFRLHLTFVSRAWSALSIRF